MKILKQYSRDGRAPGNVILCFSMKVIVSEDITGQIRLKNCLWKMIVALYQVYCHGTYYNLTPDERLGYLIYLFFRIKQLEDEVILCKSNEKIKPLKIAI